VRRSQNKSKPERKLKKVEFENAEYETKSLMFAIKYMIIEKIKKL
jgi:hypothetical protein